MCEVTGQRKQGNGLEVPCVYIPLCSKAMTYQKAQNFAATFRPLRVMPVLVFFAVVVIHLSFVFLPAFINKTFAKKYFARLVYILKK